MGKVQEVFRKCVKDFKYDADNIIGYKCDWRQTGTYGDKDVMLFWVYNFNQKYGKKVTDLWTVCNSDWYLLLDYKKYWKKIHEKYGESN